MASKKPGDETIRSHPDLGGPEDSFVGNPSSGSIKKLAEAAPEASQGAWRERVFTPRAVLSADEVLSGLRASLRVALGTANHPRVAWDSLRKAWLPFLRQALEQLGGDGIDVWLDGLFARSSREPRQPLFTSLGEAMQRLATARDLAIFEEEAQRIVGLVEVAWAQPQLARLSFKQLEKQLEGKLEVDELLAIRGNGTDALTTRLTELGSTMEQLRDEIRATPGRQPTGMYSNFVRLKTEARVLDAELNRRRGRVDPLPTS